MFQRLKNIFCWRTQFDSEWKAASTFFEIINFKHYSHNKIKEKKYLWREEKGRHYSPGRAVFSAYEEFCNEYYAQHKGEPNIEKDFLEMGHALEYAAPKYDEDGNDLHPMTYFDQRWQDYAERGRVHHEAEKARKRRSAKEIESLRFKPSEIDAAWERLISDDIPEEASRIWFHSFPKKPGHDIANEAGVSIRDFVFWMCVFRQHLGFVEVLISGTHLYHRPYGDNEDLSLAVVAEAKRRAD